MKVLNFRQGDAPWHTHRATARNASEAAAALGCHPQKTRDQLLHERYTGLTKEHSQFVQERVLAGGHAIEGKLRAVAEAIIGDDLGPLVGCEVVSGIELSASFDGLTLMWDTNWECKSLNAELRAALPHQGEEGIERNDAANLPKYHRVQMQQQCMVSGCTKVLFTASDGEGDDRHCWFYPDAALGAEIIAGWKQFDEDLASYTPPAITLPVPTGRAPETLPALLITVKGEVTASNLAEFKETALSAIRSVNRELTTDQHFADAEKAVKWCEDVEARLKASKEHALSQTASIDQLFKVMDDINAEARQTRLDLEKLVKARKQSLKTEILVEAQTALADFLRAKNAKLGRDYMPHITTDFAGAIHGKKNFDSMRSAINAALANAKIEANAVADRIESNLVTLREQAADHKFLFADTAQIVLKAPDDLTALVKTRIAEHDAAEKKKQEDAREAMRLELEAKAEAASRAALVKIQGIQNQLQAAQGAKPATVLQIIADTEAVVVNVATFGVHSELAIDAKRKTLDELRAMVFHPNGAPKYSTTSFRSDGEPIMLNADGTRSVFCDVDEDGGDDSAPAPAPAANVVSMPTPQESAARILAARLPVAAPSAPPTLKLGDINALLSPIQLTADGLRALGFEPAGRDRSAVLYHHRDLSAMCAALHDLLDQVQAKQAA